MSESIRATNQFPDRLRAARDKRQLDQAGLAAKAGLQASAISHFETGSRKPSFDNLRRLAEALDVSTDYLLGRVDDPKGFTGASRLHRHYDALSDADRRMADDFVRMLADKAAERGRKKK